MYYVRYLYTDEQIVYYNKYINNYYANIVENYVIINSISQQNNICLINYKCYKRETKCYHMYIKGITNTGFRYRVRGRNRLDEVQIYYEYMMDIEYNKN